MPASDLSATDARVTAGSVLRQTIARLRSAGVDGAGDEARRLVAHVLGVSPAELLSRPGRPITPAEAVMLAQFADRRAVHEPVSRIVGERDFYGRSFSITPATLDPRPDSETVIAATLELARMEGWQRAPLRIADVGTGSGCLLVTLLCELPGAFGVGTDVSVAALQTARMNAERLGVAQRAAWVAADALEALGRAPFDLLIANPPYVRSGEIAGLAPEVRDFDPVLALDGGADGLELYRRVAKRIGNVLPDGWSVFEVGHDQAEAVARLLCSAGLGIRPQEVRFYRDLAGLRRCVAARTRN